MSYISETPINQALEAVISMMNAVNPFATVTRGALPTGAGLTCELAPSRPTSEHMDRNTVIPLDVTLNGKHEDLQLLSDTMHRLHRALTRETDYPREESWQIIDITNNTLPQIIGREQNNEWLMASSLNVKFYWRGD